MDRKKTGKRQEVQLLSRLVSKSTKTIVSSFPDIPSLAKMSKSTSEEINFGRGETSTVDVYMIHTYIYILHKVDPPDMGGTQEGREETTQEVNNGKWHKTRFSHHVFLLPVIVSLCHAHGNDAIVEISLTFTRQAEPGGTGGILNDREIATSQVEFI